IAINEGSALHVAKLARVGVVAFICPTLLVAAIREHCPHDRVCPRPSGHGRGPTLSEDGIRAGQQSLGYPRRTGLLHVSLTSFPSFLLSFQCTLVRTHWTSE
ncbi:hypothetical protein B0H17DRAFT_1061943, partial [Mycena rosella]